MKNKLIIGFLILLPWCVDAQVTVSAQLPPAGMIQKDQLWNLMIVNNTNNAMDVVISLNLQDPISGQSVVSAATRAVTLNKGVKMLSISDIQPVQYNYGVAGYTGTFIPLGSYNACYMISKLNVESQEPVSSECVRINISPLSPPLLNMPADMATIPTPYPQLTWVAPTPMDMFSDLSYDLNVVEILQGQSPTEAISNNTPLFNKSNIRVPYENYPSTYSKLEQGKVYAWQVTARNGMNYAAATEVWTFKLAKDSSTANVVNAIYIPLTGDRNESGLSIVTEKTINIKYYSLDKARDAIVRVADVAGNTVQEIKQNIVYGENYLRISLSNAVHKERIYSVSITDLQGKKYSASFSIK